MNRRKAPRGGGPLSARPLGPILAAAHDEAETARHGYVGVEHLLVALTQGPAAQLLSDHGVTSDRARRAAQVVVSSGRGDGPRWDAATLLGTLGVDLDEIRRQVETQFGPDAVRQLYTSEIGWNLRPRGPLCGLRLSAQLKRAADDALGHCWDAAPPHLHQRLLRAALDTQSAGLTAVLDELAVPIRVLRAAVISDLQVGR